ncbi:MAG: hypothetical protein Q8O16_01670 [Dehalococcoidia bacterium]|nr:hypothetical protein [Dehalococcoidia bacterium]
MDTNVIKRQTPEEEELLKKREELATLENELAQNELDLATLEAELNVFITRYLGTVGVRYSEVDEINAQIAEAEARLKPREKTTQDKAKEARFRAGESAKATKDINQPEQPQKFKPEVVPIIRTG